MAAKQPKGGKHDAAPVTDDTLTERKEAVAREMAAILNRHGFVFHPVLEITPDGVRWRIEYRPVQ